MNATCRKAAGSILILCIMLSSYLMIVQLVEALGPGEFFDSFEVRSLRGSSSKVFSVGDSVVFEFKSRWADSYLVEAFCNSSLAFAKRGVLSLSDGVVKTVIIALRPPAFKAGNLYAFFFHGYSINKPIIGTSYEDSFSTFLEVVGVETQLQLTGEYISECNELCLYANMTDAEGYPVVNESIAFSMTHCDRPELTDGFLPVGEARTNESGVSFFSLGLCGPTGNYSFTAFHEANENFGEAVKVIQVEVSPNMTFEDLGSYYRGESNSFQLLSSDEVLISCSQSLYALLENLIVVTYRTAAGPQGHFVARLYLVPSGIIIAQPLLTYVRYYSGYFEYQAAFQWYPDDAQFIGDHAFLCRVLDVNGTELLNSDFHPVQIYRHPSRLVLNLPEVSHGDCVPVTAVFSKSRVYEIAQTDFYVQSRLAPMWKYYYSQSLERECTEDEAVGSIPITLYVNQTCYNATTNQNGIASFLPQLGMTFGSQTNFTVNLTSPGLYNLTATLVSSSLSNVDVRDVNTGAADIMKLNCGLIGPSGENNSVVGCTSSLNANVTFCGKPVENAAVSFLAAKYMCQGAASTGIFVNNSYNYLRLVAVTSNSSSFDGCISISFYRSNGGPENVTLDSQGFAAIPPYANGFEWLKGLYRGDLDGNEKINILDIVQVALHFGSVKGETQYKPSVDIYGDGRINILDIVPVASYFGRVGYSIITATLDFYKVDFSSAVVTNNAGLATATWIPNWTDRYVVKANLPEYFNVTTTASFSDLATRGHLNVYSYCEVAKRNVSLTIDVPDVHVERIYADADAFVDEGYHGIEFGGWENLAIGVSRVTFWNYMNWTYVHFNLSAIPREACITQARLYFHVSEVFDQYGVPMQSISLNVSAYRVTSSWNEATITWDYPQPSCSSEPSYSYSWFFAANTSMILDVTNDVQSWASDPAQNYGLVVKAGDWGIASIDSRENSREECWRPFLLVSYAAPSVGAVRMYDCQLNQPVSNAQIQWNSNDSNGTCSTNSTGVALPNWRFDSNIAYSVSATYLSNETYEPAYASQLFDFRLPTELVSFEGNQIAVPFGMEAHGFEFNMSTPNPLVCFGWSRVVLVSINGTFNNGTSYSGVQMQTWVLCCCPVSGYETGIAYICFDWEPPKEGMYTFAIEYSGDDIFKPSELLITVTVAVTPLAVLFVASPKELQSGDNFSLTAELKHAGTNTSFTGHSVRVEFIDCHNDSSTNSTIVNSDPASGIATLNNVFYTAAGSPHAFKARVISETLGDALPQGIVSNPLQLTVANTTTLFLNVTRPDPSSTVHHFFGNASWNGAGVPNRAINVTINQTLYVFRNKTDANGCFEFNVDLKPVGNAATPYEVLASFEDNVTIATNCTAWSKTPDGMDYAACTTVQYGYKPATKALSLEVTYESTTVIDPDSPENIEDRMRSEGLLETWIAPGGSWLDWMRLYVRIHIPWYNLTIKVWTGIPFGAGIEELSGFENIFISIYTGLSDALVQSCYPIITNALTTTAIAFTVGATATALSQGTPFYFPMLLAYTVGMGLAIGCVRAFADAAFSRSILNAVCGCLLGFVIGMFAVDPLFNLNRSLAAASISGTSAQVEAIRGTFNFLVNSGIKLAATVLGFGCWIFNRPFLVATAGLGLAAGFMANYGR